jgi:hypothetical protein
MAPRKSTAMNMLIFFMKMFLSDIKVVVIGDRQEDVTA